MYFDGYTKDNTGAYMILISEDISGNKTVLINLLDIEFVQVEECDTDVKILKTKDGEVYFFREEDKKIEQLPKGFKWSKRIYKSEKWYDAKNDWRAYDITLVNKLEALLSNPEILLNKLKKACEDAEV